MTSTPEDDFAMEEGDLSLDSFERLPRPKAPAQVYSIRIPVDRLAELRALADDLGKAPTAMIREWVLERLDRERGPSPHRWAAHEDQWGIRVFHWRSGWNVSPLLPTTSTDLDDELRELLSNGH